MSALFRRGPMFDTRRWSTPFYTLGARTEGFAKNSSSRSSVFRIRFALISWTGSSRPQSMIGHFLSDRRAAVEGSEAWPLIALHARDMLMIAVLSAMVQKVIQTVQPDRCR